MQLPPYGLFSVGLRQYAADPTIMSDWRPGIPEEDRLTSFHDWRNDILRRLSDSIWPSFDRAQKKWIGQASQWSEAATKRELELVAKHFQGANAQINKMPTLSKSPEFGHSHLEQFRVEDNPDQPAAINLRDYVSDLSEAQFHLARSVVDDAYESNKLPGLFWFKNEFTRPRPYQTAHIYSLYNFENYPALSARHSSFYSGHCLEGIIISATIFDLWQSDSASYSNEQIEALSRFAVDFGDRRVFAGVHYPSDNVGSWVIALNLIPNIFKNSAPVLQFVKNAITNYSVVFNLIDMNYRTENDLNSIVGILDRELNAQKQIV